MSPLFQRLFVFALKRIFNFNFQKEINLQKSVVYLVKTLELLAFPVLGADTLTSSPLVLASACTQEAQRGREPAGTSGLRLRGWLPQRLCIYLVNT